jgi:hypothetical protein
VILDIEEEGTQEEIPPFVQEEIINLDESEEEK